MSTKKDFLFNGFLLVMGAIGITGLFYALFILLNLPADRSGLSLVERRAMEQPGTSAQEAQQMVKDCTDAGGQPIYDLCARHIELIKLPGYQYAPEVDEYK